MREWLADVKRGAYWQATLHVKTVGQMTVQVARGRNGVGALIKLSPEKQFLAQAGHFYWHNERQKYETSAVSSHNGTHPHEFFFRLQDDEYDGRLAYHVDFYINDRGGESGIEWERMINTWRLLPMWVLATSPEYILYYPYIGSPFDGSIIKLRSPRSGPRQVTVSKLPGKTVRISDITHDDSPREFAVPPSSGFRSCEVPLPPRVYQQAFARLFRQEGETSKSPLFQLMETHNYQRLRPGGDRFRRFRKAIKNYVDKGGNNGLPLLIKTHYLVRDYDAVIRCYRRYMIKRFPTAERGRVRFVSDRDLEKMYGQSLVRSGRRQEALRYARAALRRARAGRRPRKIRHVSYLYAGVLLRSGDYSGAYSVLKPYAGGEDAAGVAALQGYIGLKKKEGAVRLDPLPAVPGSGFNYCVPAAAAFIHRYFGAEDVSPRAIAQEMGTGGQGTSFSRMLVYFKKHNLNSKPFFLSFDTVVSHLRAGRPVLIFLKSYNRVTGHAVVVVGADPKEKVLYLYEPSRPLLFAVLDQARLSLYSRETGSLAYAFLREDVSPSDDDRAAVYLQRYIDTPSSKGSWQARIDALNRLAFWVGGRPDLHRFVNKERVKLMMLRSQKVPSLIQRGGWLYSRMTEYERLHQQNELKQTFRDGYAYALYMARIALHFKKTTLAEQALKRVLDRAPDHLEAAYHYARLRVKAKEADKEIKALIRRALRTADPLPNGEAWLKRFRLLQAGLAYRNGNIKQAAVYLMQETDWRQASFSRRRARMFLMRAEAYKTLDFLSRFVYPEARSGGGFPDK